jgi:hypothetical protein
MPVTVRSTALCQLIYPFLPRSYLFDTSDKPSEKHSSKKNGPEESAHIGNATAFADFAALHFCSGGAGLRRAALLETVDCTPRRT